MDGLASGGKVVQETGIDWSENMALVGSFFL